VGTGAKPEISGGRDLEFETQKKKQWEGEGARIGSEPQRGKRGPYHHSKKVQEVNPRGAKKVAHTGVAPDPGGEDASLISRTARVQASRKITSSGDSIGGKENGREEKNEKGQRGW